MEHALDGGFATPVLDAQRSFRAIMDALSNPGVPQTLADPGQAPATLPQGLASIVLTLADADTPIWLSDTLRQDESVAAFIRFHTGAAIADAPAAATFALATHASELPALAAFNLGTQEYPDRSSTVILAVPALTGGAEITARGPGIKGHGHIAPQGLPADFLPQWEQNRELFPRGVDLLLVEGDQVLGLPRSTRLSEGH